MSVYKHKLDQIQKPERKPKDALFLYADGLTSEDIAFQNKYAEAKNKRGLIGLSESETLSLVKASKSPTPVKPRKQPEIPGLLGGFKKIEKIPVAVTPAGTKKAYATFSYREWSDEWRVRTRVQNSVKPVPPEHYGERVTKILSDRGARKLRESCAYVAACHGGYTTFLTLTFNERQRARILTKVPYSLIACRSEIQPMTIQKEVSRFCDGLTKIWQRGWIAEFTIRGRRVACMGADGAPLGEDAREEEPMLYCWVAEVPENKKGKLNPHVHFLIRWKVPRELFPSWAKRLEELWGNGFAHLEKIRDENATAAYMMKAAGYLCKAQGKTNQGLISGNRYGISKEARAPDWVVVEEAELHNMSRLIVEINEHLTEKFGALYDERRTLNAMRDKLPKNSNFRKPLNKRLAWVRNRLAELPIVANKYQLIFKGKSAFYEFLAWARSPGHWKAVVCDWLPKKEIGNHWRPGIWRK